MAARSGSEFLERLAAARVHVEVQGETLTGGVADHPAFRNVVRSYAELYDMQHDPAFRDVLTYPSPATGAPVATAFLTPRTPEDLVKRRKACKLWADRSLGMLGRTGDYLNSALMALASAQDWFAQAGPGFGENIRRYYEKVREEDLLCTHTLIPPQANRALSGSQQAGGALMAHIVREDDNGIVIRGARMLATIGPFADELLVFPSTVLRNTPEDKQYSFACAIPNDATGLRYLAREPLDYGRPRHDHPHHGQDRVHPRPALAAHPGHRHRAVPSRPGRRGRGHHHAGDAARAAARGRSRRGAERVRRAHPGLGAAEHRPEPLPPALPAVPRDLAQARRVRPDGHADRGRRDRSRRGRHRDLPAVRHAGRGRAGQAVPAGLGHLHLGLLRAAGAVRVLLLRRSGADGRPLRGQLRPRALQGRRPRLP